MAAATHARRAGTPPAPLDSLTGPLRNWAGGRIRQILLGQTAPSRRTAELVGPDRADPGLFGPDSVTWRVHGNLSMLIGGLRSLLLQTLHPLAMAGVAQHSDYRGDPGGRMRRTAQFVSITTFGSTAEAEAAIERVRNIHRRVRGVSATGVPYRADDPALLAWVHATEVDSFWRAYRRYGGGPGEHRVPRSEADRYVAEMAVVARRIGVPDPPVSAAELREYLVEMRPVLRATPETHDAVRFLLHPPTPRAARPAYLLVAGGAVGLLPSFVRHELRLPLLPGVEPLVVRPAARTLLDVLGWVLAPPPEPTSDTASTREPAPEVVAEVPRQEGQENSGSSHQGK
jgi:uncharacterized protein (DUF2236 family)